MTKNSYLISSNFRFLSRHPQLMREENLASFLGCTDNELEGYLSGKPLPYGHVDGVLQYFNIRFEDFTGKDFETLTKEELDQVFARKYLTPFVQVGFVSKKVGASYPERLDDEKFVDELAALCFPVDPSIFSSLKTGNFRAFEIDGDSMEPSVKDEDVVIAEQVVDTKDVVEGKRYIVVTSSGILFKRLYRVKNYSTTKNFVLVSDNPVYAPSEIEEDQILELWELHRLIARP